MHFGIFVAFKTKEIPTREITMQFFLQRIQISSEPPSTTVCCLRLKYDIVYCIYLMSNQTLPRQKYYLRQTPGNP